MDTSGLTRSDLIQWIEKLAQERLPERSRETGEYPVQEDHCFQRIAYDAVCSGRWDRSVKPPFAKNARTEQLRAAVEILIRMIEDPKAAHRLNQASLSYRRSDRTEERPQYE